MTIGNGYILEAAARLETQDGDDIVNTFQFKYLGVPPLTDLQGIDDVIEFLESIYTLILAIIPVLTVFRDVSVRNKTSSIVYGTFPWASVLTPTAAGNDLPPACSLLTVFNTGIARLQLRKYWGNLADSGITAEGLLQDSSVVDGLDAAAIMLVPFTATNGQWEYGYDSPVALEWVVPTSALGTNVPAYQRRRKQGRGS